MRGYLLAVSVFMIMTITSSFADAVPGEYLVKFKKLPLNIQGMARDLKGIGISVVIPGKNIALVKPDSARVANGDILDALRARADVVSVQPNYRYHSTLYIPESFLARARRLASTNLVQNYLSLPAPELPNVPVPKEKPVIVKPDVKAAPTSTAGADTLAEKDKDLELSNVKDAWKIEKGNKDVVVAVIDTGIDYNHEDLAENIWHDPSNPSTVGWDFVDNDAKPYDVTGPINIFSGGGNPGHGTHCAGNVGAVGENSLGTSGIAKHVSIMAMRMLNEDGGGDTVAGIKAVDWAVEHGAKIISASWGSEGESEGDSLLKEAIQRAEAKGVLFIAAAGNTGAAEQKDADNDNNSLRAAYPATFNLSNIISVAASDQSGKMANFTHFGAKSVHLAAPGEKSFSTVPTERDVKAYLGDGKYEDMMELPIFGKVGWNGTSMATPQVAGAAALLLAHHPDWTYAQIKKRLMDSVRAEPSFKGKIATGGVLDVAQALKD